MKGSVTATQYIMDAYDIAEIAKAVEQIFISPFQLIWDEFDALKAQIFDLKILVAFFSAVIILFLTLSFILILLHIIKLERIVKQCHRDNLILQDKIIDLIKSSQTDTASNAPITDTIKEDNNNG